MPVNQYPNIPCHQIEHIHVEHMHCMHPPPPPPPPPVFQNPASPLLPAQHFQPPFGGHLEQPWNWPPPQPQGSRIDYSARLMENFHSDHQRRRSRRANCSSASVNPSAGPISLPPVQHHQHVLNFQHDEVNQQLLQQRIQHQRLEQEQQAILQQRLIAQRQLEEQQHQAMIQHHMEHQRYLQQHQQALQEQQEQQHNAVLQAQ